MRTLIVCAVMLAALTTVSPGVAQNVPNVPVDRLVVLVGDPEGGFCFSGDLPFNKRVLPTGEIVPFTIPEGRTLVITDVNWFYGDSLENRFPNAFQSLSVYVVGDIPAFNPVVVAGAQLDQTSRGSANISMTSGFTAAKGTIVCGRLLRTQFGPQAVFLNTIIRGYLR